MSSIITARVVATTFAALCSGATLAFATLAFAQQVPSKVSVVAPPAVVTGRITGPDKKALADAEVVLGSAERTVTDKKGRFEFDPVVAGVHEVLVRKIGFTPVRFNLAVTAGDLWDGTIALERTAQSLPEIVVLDSSKALKNFRPRWIDDFLARRRAGFGTFLDRVDIENSNEPSTARLVMRAAGITASTGTGNYDELHVNRCNRSVGGTNRGIIYVDGMKAEESVRGRFVTLIDYPPSRLSAIEVYTGIGTLPALYSDPTACLVVLLWTKQR